MLRRRSIVLLSLVSLVAGCADPMVRELERRAASPITGPYLSHLTQTEATITWHMPTSAPATLKLLANERLSPDQPAVRILAVQPEAAQYPEKPPYWKKPRMVQPDCKWIPFYVYRAKLTGLKPGQVYGYEIGGPAGPTVSIPMAAFRTLPDKPEPFNFIVYGDIRSNPAVHAGIAKMFLSRDPAFILHTGDMVANDHYPQWKPMFFDPLAGVLDRVMLFPAIGNHERTGLSYATVFGTPRSRFYHSFDYGNAHFVSLDAVGPRFGRVEERAEMLRWLEEDLSRSKATWKIVYYHTPSYDMSYHRGEWGREDVLPILRKHGVDFVFTGDSHTYQRFRPLVTPGENDDRPLTHITTAGGGAGLYWIVEAEPYLAVASKIHHYMTVRIDGPTLTGEAVTLDGKLLDSFTVRKDAAGTPDAAWRQAALPEEPLAAIGHSLGEAFIELDRPPTAEHAGRAEFPLTAGGNAMTYRIQLAPASEPLYDMPAIEGRCDANEEVTIPVAVKLKPNAKLTNPKGQLKPFLVLECVFEIDGLGLKGRIQSYPVSARKDD